jgi:U3 small nucleolar ribonucleoprotein component
MPAPHKFTRKLHEVIGVEAAEAMVDWMNRTDERFDEVQRELSEFRQPLRADFAEFRQEMNGKLSELREQMAEDRGETRAGFANVEASAAKRHADFMKWTLGFWVASLLTYVGALVALAQVLR